MPISTFADGFGRRFASEADAQPPAESLQFCDDLARIEGIEAALAERLSLLATFAHPGVAASRSVERTADGVELRSERVTGTRLSEVLRAAERNWLDPDLPSALAVLRQVTTAVAALHEHARHAAHGALGPERIVLRDDGMAVVTEVPLAAALDRADATRTALWRQYRVAVPAVAGAPTFGQTTDLMQLGMLALALVRGRLLGRDDFPARLPSLLKEVAVADPLGHRPAVPRAVGSWIGRALQFDTRAAFRSVREAEAALVRAIADSGVDGSTEASVAEWSAAVLSGRALVRPAAPPAVTAAPPPLVQREDSARPSRAEPATQPPTAASGRRRTPRVARPAGHRRLLGRVVRVSIAVAALLLAAGGAYLGAQAFLGFPSFLFPTGHLTVESRPAGLEVLLDGKPKGTTPVSLEVRSGRYTLALRSSRSTTLMPVVVEAGAWHTERIEVRRGRPPQRTSTVRRPPPEEPRK